MENQHRLIGGYRELDQDEIAAMNAAKLLEERVLRAIEATEGLPDVDKRALALARTNAQVAFMWLVRSIARPQRMPSLPEDLPV